MPIDSVVGRQGVVLELDAQHHARQTLTQSENQRPCNEESASLPTAHSRWAAASMTTGKRHPTENTGIVRTRKAPRRS
eukprot:15023684-Alexandrium_andersonii.AAC.1